LAEEVRFMNKTNFDLYLEEQLKDSAFAERFARAGEAWDVALQGKAGLSQKRSPAAFSPPSNRSAASNRPPMKAIPERCQSLHCCNKLFLHLCNLRRMLATASFWPPVKARRARLTLPRCPSLNRPITQLAVTTVELRNRHASPCLPRSLCRQVRAAVNVRLKAAKPPWSNYFAIRSSCAHRLARERFALFAGGHRRHPSPEPFLEFLSAPIPSAAYFSPLAGQLSR
jgi:hypothetical protein